MQRHGNGAGLQIVVVFLWALGCFNVTFVCSFVPQWAVPKIHVNLKPLYSLSEEEPLGALEILDAAFVVNPSDGSTCKALDGIFLDGSNAKNPLAFLGDTLNSDQKALIVIMPQLGDFDSAEYAELLAAVKKDLDRAKISLRIIGNGDSVGAKRFANFAGLPLEVIRVDPEGKLHRELNLHGGPNWDIPSFVPDYLLRWFADYVGAANATTKEDRMLIARSWLNYMAMCAGIAAPDTLPEILGLFW